MVITLKTDRNRYYYQALKVLMAIPAFSKLTEREVQILAQLLKHRDLIEEQGIREKHLQEGMLFNRHTKAVICKTLGMDDASFRNNIHGLRKKGFLKGTSFTLPVMLTFKEVIHFEFNDITQNQKDQ